MASIFGRTHRNAVLQFRAGRMYKTGNLVKPDPRKGIVSILQQPSGAVEIQWEAEGDSASLETRTAVGTVSVARVAKCTTGRVFVVDFGSDQLFFWLQEKSEDRDEEYLALLKKLLERRSTTAGQASAPSQNSIQLSALQNILQNMNPAAPAPSPGTIDLQRVLLSAEVLEALRADPAFYMARLHPHLPQGTDPSSNVAEQLRNPQITAAAAALQAALSEPEGLREVCAAFGVTLPPGSTAGALEFLEALARQP